MRRIRISCVFLKSYGIFPIVLWGSGSLKDASERSRQLRNQFAYRKLHAPKTRELMDRCIAFIWYEGVARNAWKKTQNSRFLSG